MRRSYEYIVLGCGAIGSGAAHWLARRAGADVMAGHAEDLCVLKNWIVKRADKTEIGEYKKDDDQQNYLPATKAKFYGPFYSIDELNLFFRTQRLHKVFLSEEQDKKIKKMAQNIKPGGKGFIVLENVTTGIKSPKMRDLKIGKHSADFKDQRRHGKMALNALVKVMRHHWMDKKSGSLERGYRDEDQWKQTWKGDNLEKLNEMFSNASAYALSKVKDDIKKLLIWLKQTDVVYVGMSVLVVVAENDGKAVPIDFEHPIPKSEGEKSFNKHRKGLITGVKNLLNLVYKHSKVRLCEKVSVK